MKVFIAHSHPHGRELSDQLTHALSEAGHEVFDPASTTEMGSNIVVSIATAIMRSDIIIALLTAQNPNVYYELGIASATQVPALIASSDPENIASSLLSVPYVQLTGNVTVDVVEIARRVEEVIATEHHHAADRTPVSAKVTLAAAADDPSVLERITPAEFVQLVADFFLERGFSIRGDQSPQDQGFDLIIDGDPLTMVEIKRYAPRNLVSVGVVRQLFSTMIAMDVGRAILISSSGFTKSAKAAATRWPIELLTLNDLLQIAGPSAESFADSGI